MRDGLLRLQGHVLHLRGGTPAAQPYGIDVSGVPTPPLPLSETVSGADVVVAQADTHWLLLNGQVYEGLPGLDAAASDTAALAAALAAASTASDSAVAAALGGVVAALRGPFALVWWDVSREELWFARDATGRRSLCVAATEATLHLASTATNDITEDNDHFVRWHELPAAGLYRARLDAAGQLAHVTLYPWPSASGYVDAALAVFAPLPVRVEAPLLPPNLMTKPVTGGDAVDGLGAVLGRAVALRVATFANGESRDALPSVGVLFSGGVDCMVLAALAARALPPGMPIDLLTVAFENRRRKAFDAASAFDVPDRKTAIAGAEELRKIAPDRQWRLIGVNVTAEALEAKRCVAREESRCGVFLSSSCNAPLSSGSFSFSILLPCRLPLDLTFGASLRPCGRSWTTPWAVRCGLRRGVKAGCWTQRARPEQRVRLQRRFCCSGWGPMSSSADTAAIGQRLSEVCVCQ